MPDCHNWMEKYHSGTGEAHDFAHTLTHIGFIAMDGAFAASALPLAKLAMFQTTVGILKKHFTIITQMTVTLFITAIDGNHCRNSSLLLFYP